MLDRTAAQPLSEQLAERLAQRVRDGLLLPGARLPSVRACAVQQGVSPHTVVAAYDLLAARGFVEARAQRGFYVRDSMQKRPAGRSQTARAAILSGAPAAGAMPRGAALMRSLFSAHAGRPQPGSGVLPVEWMETDFLPAALRRAAAGEGFATSTLLYGEPAGATALRTVLADRLAELSIPAQAGQIVTTQGATQALDLVSRTLLKPGDAVLVEEPGWSVEFARLTALGMRLLPVPRGADGPDLAVMAHLCRQHRPRLFVSVSVLHNPTGHCLAPGTAHRVLQLAAEHGFWVLEDDTYGHLAPPHATRLAALDGLARSVYVSGYAKVLAPAWRVGFLAAPAELVEPLLDTKMLAGLTTPSLFERALAHCIEQGQLRRHADRLRSRLEAARARCVRLALQHGCRFASEPAGLFGWVDVGVDTTELAQRLHDQGWLIAPGALFYAGRTPSTCMRVNFASAQDAAFWRALAAARDAMG